MQAHGDRSQLIVQKYGGSSVGTPAKIRQVADRVACARREGNKVVVVVSAMGDTTDELIDLAKKVTRQPHEREMDMLLSAGERISMALLSMALRDLGIDAVSFTGSQAGILTDESHTRARILEVRPKRVEEELARGVVVIVAGFQGVSRTKEVTTLGRGGSDTTAAALAAALRADRCEVLTDVPGIFSADPRLVSNAIRYEALPADLVLELSVKGAQVMHPRSIEIARDAGFPIYVGLAHNEGNTKEEGTMIYPTNQASDLGLELPKVVAITAKKGLTRLRFAKDYAQKALAEATKSSLLVHFVEVSTDGSLELCVQPSESEIFLEHHVHQITDQHISMVSMIGYQLQSQTGVSEAALQALREQGIDPRGLTASSQSITVWTQDADADKAVAALHARLVRKN